MQAKETRRSAFWQKRRDYEKQEIGYETVGDADTFGRNVDFCGDLL
jgi:hypothetical protein